MQDSAKIFLTLFYYLLFGGCIFSQPYTIQTFNWKDAGFKGSKPVYTQTVNIMNQGGNNTGTGANNSALNAAINALNNKGGVIYFPKGVYNFTSNVTVNRDSITFKGAGYDSTELRFSMNGQLNNCFSILGTTLANDSSSFSSAGIRDSNKVTVLNASPFQVGDWVYLQTKDDTYMYSTWAYGSLGQVMRIKSKTGNILSFDSPFRFYYKLSLQPRITRLNVRKAIGFECLKIKRKDATAQQTSLLSFDKAVQCWVHGVEGDTTNYSHVELNRVCNIEVTNSYFHHAFAYGGSGQAYGVTFQFSASECKVENCIFRNLRHSMLFQAGANGNVCGYNYSFDPYWNEGILPPNSAGDMVLHGNYPFANLFEGNINQNTVIDNSHAKSGPYNTFFRNRSELWGLVMNNNPATDTVQFLGLEITNTTPPYGQYVISGNGHLQFGNKVKGILTPNTPGTISEISLYYTGAQRPLCFVTGLHNWPLLGIPNTYNTGSNAARDRALSGQWAKCDCGVFTNNKEASGKYDELIAYPNPVGERMFIKGASPVWATIYSVEGRIIASVLVENNYLDLGFLKSGLYFLEIQSKHSNKKMKLLKE